MCIETINVFCDCLMTVILLWVRGTDDCFVCWDFRFQLVSYSLWEGISCLLSLFKSVEDKLACVNETFDTIYNTHFCPWVKLGTRLIHALFLYRKTSTKPQRLQTLTLFTFGKITSCLKPNEENHNKYNKKIRTWLIL